MTVYEKIVETGKNFNHNTYVIYTLNGDTGRIVDHTSSLSEARSYAKIGKKNGLSVYVAEYNPNTNEVCFDIH